MTTYRTETDMLGTKKISNKAYYGINTARALENFNITGRTVNMKLIHGMVLIKKAAAMANRHLKQLEKDKAQAIMSACDEVLAGDLADQFLVDPLQGGAGTSTNMNVNEVIANRAIELLGGQKGDYDLVHPLNDVNLSQSTNDVYPTALRIAAIRELRNTADAFAALQEALQIKENEFADILKLGRTQMMDALPMMVGQEFGAWSKAIARDRWRIYKVEERLRQINIGGTAIGTGMNASHKFIFLMTDLLQDMTGLGLARSEFPIDVTQNMDVFTEVSGLLKSAAVNLVKISGDLRLLGSGPKGGLGELNLPPVQAGSTIMPGKVNPVMAEMMGQVSMKVMANDFAITQAAMSGQLELNAFVPLIAESLLESLEILTNGVSAFREKCIEGITVNPENTRRHLENSTALVTALVHHVGYDKSSEIAKIALREGKSIRQVVLEDGCLSNEALDKILNPFQITNPGIPGK